MCKSLSLFLASRMTSLKVCGHACRIASLAERFHLLVEAGFAHVSISERYKRLPSASVRSAMLRAVSAASTVWSFSSRMSTLSSVSEPA